jgi:hypothetical protein
MEDNTKLGDSLFQREIEAKIIQTLESKEIYGTNDKVYAEKVPIGKTTTKVHFVNYSKVDFVDYSKKIFCEIYTCGPKLIGAQKFKVRNDILKLIAIEKTIAKPIEKIIILTVFENDVENDFLEVEAQIKKHSKSLFGEKTWLQSVIQLFEIKILFYSLDAEDYKKLLLNKEKQAKGNSKKIS